MGFRLCDLPLESSLITEHVLQSFSSSVSSPNTIKGANGLPSLLHAMLLRRPGTDEGTLLPNRKSTLRSLNLIGDEASCLANDGIASFSEKGGQLFSLGLVSLNRGCRKGLAGDSCIPEISNHYKTNDLNEKTYMIAGTPATIRLMFLNPKNVTLEFPLHSEILTCKASTEPSESVMNKSKRQNGSTTNSKHSTENKRLIDTQENRNCSS